MTKFTRSPPMPHLKQMPGLGRREDGQIRTAAVDMEGTPANEASALALELDAVLLDHGFDGVRLLEGSHVHPARASAIAGPGNAESHVG
jgi:hypothetical protein